MSKVIWIDTETTGLEFEKHGLREVACIVEIDNIVIDEFLLYIDTTTYKNEKYISKYVKDAMGITEDKLKEYPSSASQMEVFRKKVEQHIDLEDKNDKFMFAGFNVKFDSEFIKDWYKDNGCAKYFYKSFGYQEIDVLGFVRKLKYLELFETENNQLKTLSNHFDIEIDAHEALSDIQATKKLDELLSDRFVSDSTNDRLTELEKQIRDYYVSDGFVLGTGWWFKVFIGTMFKVKELEIHFFKDVDVDEKVVCSIQADTTKEMFDKAFEFFKITGEIEHDKTNLTRSPKSSD